MPSKRITLADVEILREQRPQRRCFAEFLIVRERGEEYVVGALFPSIARLFESDTGIAMKYGPYGPYCYLGFAEHNAKSTRNRIAVERLASACIDIIGRVSAYSESDCVCAVPPSPEKVWDLPTEIARIVASKTNKADVSALVRFQDTKSSVKSISLEDKWGALERGKLTVFKEITGRTIILIDDKYQSRTTAQFVGSGLYAAGAAAVNGLFCIKTWRNRDNL